MNFSPHHVFANCARLEKRVAALRAAGAVPDAVFSAYENYHYSLLHKLRSARYHLESLEGYLASGTAQTANPEDLVYRVNFHFDGFLHVVGSATDIFAREMLTYFNITLPAKVYFRTARSKIAAARPGDAVLPFLADPNWKAEFSDYRNTATHESLIGTEYTIQVSVKGGASSKRLVFPVPDDPRASPPSTKHNPDIVAYCQKTFKRSITLFNVAYGHVEARAKAAGALPL